MITAEQIQILQQIEADTRDLVLRGMTDVREIAETVAVDYINGYENDEMIEMIGDIILCTKSTILN